MTPKDKREIIYKVFGFTIINLMKDILNKEMKEMKEKLDTFVGSLTSLQGQLDTSYLQLEALNKKLLENSDEELKISKAELDKYTEVRDLHESKKSAFLVEEREFRIALSEYTSLISKTRAELVEIKKKLNLYDNSQCPTCTGDLGTEFHQTLKHDLQAEMDRINGKYQGYLTSYESMKEKEKELEKDKPSAAIVSMHTDLTPGGQKEEAKEEKEEKKKKVKDDKPSRGIETMFRITSTNHIRLSAMADSKANIMISVNSIIISVVLSMLVRKIEDYPHLVLPTIVLLVVNVSAIIFSVLATRPNITKGTFTHEDVKMKRVNLLFFGNFHKMGLGDYEMGVKAMMGDNDYLYSGMIRDIYFLGVVLGKKYRLLRISYTIFMFGIVLAILAFAASIYMFKGK
jgi:hypothetical protein